MAGCLNHGLCGLNDGAEYGLLRRVKRQRCGERVLFSDSRGWVDGLVGDVSVEFLGEVIVFALHLISEVADSSVHLAAQVVKTVVHIIEPGVHVTVQVASSVLFKITDSIVQDR